jgi:hypothetical protein
MASATERIRSAQRSLLIERDPIVTAKEVAWTASPAAE